MDIIKRYKKDAKDAVKSEDYQKAIYSYEKIGAISEEAFDNNDFKLYCISLIELELWGKAAKTLNKWKLINHSSATLYSMLGFVYSELELYNEAEDAYRNSAKLKPSASIYCALGDILIKNDHVKEARKCFEKALIYDSKSVDAYLNLGLLLREINAGEAEENFRQALLNDSKCFIAMAELGFILSRQGKYEEAESVLEDTIKIKADYFWAHVYLANLLWQKKESDKAEKEYKKAIDLAPNSKEPYQWYGDFLKNQGRESESAVNYKKANELSQ